MRKSAHWKAAASAGVAAISLFWLLSPAQASEKPWEGDIAEADLRRKQIVDLIRQKQAPAVMKLRYSRTESDFLVFYDLEGKDIYFRYREDRFDLDAEEKIAHLSRGEAYEVSGPFAGIMLYSVLYSDENPKFSEVLDKPDSVPVFVFKGARPLRIDQILF